MDIVTKTFRAPNMLLALQQVQRELGSDAIVVSMRKVPGGPAWQVWREPIVEVIAMKNAGQYPSLAENKKNITEKRLKNQNLAQTGAKKSEEPIEKQSSTKDTEGNTKNKKQPTPRPAANLLDVINQYQAQTQPVTIHDDGGNQDVNIKNIKTAASKDTSELKSEIQKIINTLTAIPENQSLYQPDTDSQKKHWKPFNPPRVNSQKPGTVQNAASTIDFQQVNTTDIEGEKTAEIILSTPLPKALSTARDQLVDQELDENFVNQLIINCQDILPAKSLNDKSRVRTLLQRQLEAEIKAISPHECFSSKNIFLIGSSGSGKTSSCAKLAAYVIHTLEKHVIWVCADTYRASAITEARTFTDLINIPLSIAYTSEDLFQTLKSENFTDYFLIDTVNCNPRNETSIVEVGNFITQVTSRTTLMVISATTKPTDLKQALAAFKPFRIKGLIVTKMDESLTFGNIYNLARHSQVPLCFYSNGTHVFNDLIPATTQELVNSLFGEGYAI